MTSIPMLILAVAVAYWVGRGDGYREAQRLYRTEREFYLKHRQQGDPCREH